jgi:hypothetical protein
MPKVAPKSMNVPNCIQSNSQTHHICLYHNQSHYQETYMLHVVFYYKSWQAIQNRIAFTH